jgi:WD40-like Beta Propeller Repeat
VSQADFAADGRIAVVRSERGRSRLEFPIGTLLYETAGWLFSPRISADGTRVAFEEHPLHDDDRGWPAVVEVATKAKRNLTPEQISVSGLAWSPSGQDVCFASTRTIRCVGIEKRDVRNVVTGSHRFSLYDIDRDGRMLAATYALSGAQMAGEVGGREVDVSWQDLALPIDFTADGKRLVFGSLDYGVNVRGLDGGPPIRLAEGIPGGISPDGRTVLALAPGVPTTIKTVPMGPGSAQTLPRGSLESHTWAAWMPDGRSVIISASEPGHSSRLYVQDVVGGAPRAFSGDGVRLMTYLPRVVSPDGRFVMAVGPDQQPALYPVAGGDPQSIAGLAADLSPIGWGETPNVIFARGREVARLVPVFKIDLSTGRRQAVGVIGPTDAKGAPLIMVVQVSRDGRRYAYNTAQFVGALHLIEFIGGTKF